MMASKRRAQQQQQNPPQPRQPDGGVLAPTFDSCTFVVENNNPLFGSKRVLQRRTLFINDDKSRYVSAGFYPTRNYQPLVVFGGARIAPLSLTDQQVTTLAIHLPRL
jgi:hypothetical protein